MSAKAFSGQFRVRLPKSLHEKLTEQAMREGVSLNTYVITLLSARSAENEIRRILERAQQASSMAGAPAAEAAETLLLGNAQRAAVGSSSFYFTVGRVQ